MNVNEIVPRVCKIWFSLRLTVCHSLKLFCLGCERHWDEGRNEKRGDEKVSSKNVLGPGPQQEKVQEVTSTYRERVRRKRAFLESRGRFDRSVQKLELEFPDRIEVVIREGRSKRQGMDGRSRQVGQKVMSPPL